MIEMLNKGQKVYWVDPAGETSGDYEVCKTIEIKNDDDIILISNGSSEAEVYFSELIVYNVDFEKDVDKALEEYTTENGHQPQSACCSVVFKDDMSEGEQTFQLSSGGDPETDWWIFFYCDSLEGLIGLANPDNGEDFIITGFSYFN